MRALRSGGRRRAIVWLLLIHLRLPFLLTLVPVFLWGWLLAGGGLTQATLIGFIALHLFLYGGATAFNSYYDRDEGPVGGLSEPPPVPQALLPFSIALKAVGAGLAGLVNLPFLAIYLAFASLSVLYSHPRFRWKAHPISSVATVAVGQGFLAYAGAWATVRGDPILGWTGVDWLGAIASTLLILGFYPLTQVYQVDEDRARGDRTLPVALGPTVALQIAIILLVLGGLAMAGTILVAFTTLEAAGVVLVLGIQVAYLSRWATRFNPATVMANHRAVMRFSTLSAAAIGGYLVVRIALVS